MTLHKKYLLSERKSHRKVCPQCQHTFLSIQLGAPIETQLAGYQTQIARKDEQYDELKQLYDEVVNKVRPDDLC
jgi:hypothetical protein